MSKVEDILSVICDEFGDNAVMQLSSDACRLVPVYPTGIPGLDLALGIGGLPRGRVVEIFGPESSGKTTTILTAFATTHANDDDAVCAIVDAEHAIDKMWSENLGVDLDRLLIAQPDCGEEAIDVCIALVKTGKVSMILVDSVSALVPKAELEGAMGQKHIALQARLMSQAMRKLTGIISKTNTTVIFANQIREKIGVTWGNPETTSGGRALRFFSSIRIDVRGLTPKDEHKHGNEAWCRPVKFKIVKNKMAPPFKIAEGIIDFKTGFNLGLNMFDALMEKEIIEKSGNTYSIDGEKIAIGKKKVRQALMDMDKEKQLELYARLLPKEIDEEMQDLFDRKERIVNKMQEVEEGGKKYKKLKKRLNKLNQEISNA